jgi:NAD(P)-dependent dehydrogenase (short-subunit alcohol dehydrogenase family)
LRAVHSISHCGARRHAAVRFEGQSRRRHRLDQRHRRSHRSPYGGAWCEGRRLKPQGGRLRQGHGWGKGKEVAYAVPCNINQREQLEQLVGKTRAKWGRIDVLVCNAAINPVFGSMSQITDEAFDKIMGANVRSNHTLCNLVIPEMVERKDGAIVIVSSIGGLRGSPVLGAYCISKAADFQLARNIAVEYGVHNVRANCIAPGLIKTDFAKALWDNPSILERSTAGAPLKRIGEADEIAGAAVFLASKAAAFMTGQTMVIDGGATI